jgi:hypothetical protein
MIFKRYKDLGKILTVGLFPRWPGEGDYTAFIKNDHTKDVHVIFIE